MTNLQLSQNGVNEIQKLMDSPIFDSARRTNTVKSWRNEVQADWVTNFMDQMMHNEAEKNVSSNLIDDKTGKSHTVDSMVEDLKARVQLDMLKSAEPEKIESEQPAKPVQAEENFFLSKTMIIEAASKKKDLELKQNVDQFISDFFTSHRGGVDDMAVIWALREKYGIEKLRDLEKFINESIAVSRQNNPVDNMSFSLPAPYMGSPQKADHQSDMQPLFEHITNM